MDGLSKIVLMKWLQIESKNRFETTEAATLRRRQIHRVWQEGTDAKSTAKNVINVSLVGIIF